MHLEKRFISNYLSRSHYANAALFSFLVVATSLIFSLFYWDKSYHFTQFLSANSLQVFTQHEYWRLITTSFIHADLQHFLSNSLMLFILMYFMVAYFGYSMLWYSILMSGVTNGLTISFYHEHTSLVGASGIIYYLWGFWFALYLFLATQFSIPKRFARVFGVFLILLVPTTYVPETSYLAHYLGFAVGVINGTVYFAWKAKHFKSFEQWDYHLVENFTENIEEEIKLDQ
jgi:rhomboid protease GluP